MGRSTGGKDPVLAAEGTYTWVGGPTLSATPKQVSINNAAPASATQVQMSCADLDSVDHLPSMQGLRVGDTILLYVKANQASFHRYRLTALPTVNKGMYTFPVVTADGSPVGTEPTTGTQ